MDCSKVLVFRERAMEQPELVSPAVAVAAH